MTDAPDRLVGDIADDPYVVFERWFAEAQLSEPSVPEAMTVATVDAAGRPTIRNVLLKGYDHSGFVFFTHRTSRKGQALLATRQVAACFHWKSLERQVIIEGEAVEVEPREVEAYFATRPRGSQVGAWASQQSAPLPSLELLDERVAEFEAKFAGHEVPTPPHWTGFRICPVRVEFWQGKPSRLHVRTVFNASGVGWQRQWLYP